MARRAPRTLEAVRELVASEDSGAVASEELGTVASEDSGAVFLLRAQRQPPLLGVRSGMTGDCCRLRKFRSVLLSRLR